MLDLKKMLTKLILAQIPVKTSFTPTTGSNYAHFGGSFYEIIGKVIHIHLGVSGLTANSGNLITTLPNAVRPSHMVFVVAGSTTTAQISQVQVNTDGRIVVFPQGTHCGADIFYTV